MAIKQLTRDMKGKSVVDIRYGQKIATVEDVMLDPGNLNPAALVTSKGSLLKREIKAIPASEVKVWGQDVILVSNPDVIRRQEELPDLENWLSVSDDINGHQVVGLDGMRIGQIDDLLISEKGDLTAFHLSQVSADSPVGETRMIPVEAVHSLQDVLLVDLSQAREEAELADT